ncbi:hypothetical protein RJ639_000321 [Escallonia herrerae]|uniref:PARP catalytic domain-containing protein n=1 Tax=Escallonia herrerae TaxID=1293975 RepID=A0AA89BGT4_9ASTE|nr:hypothetical protein RJ639_000321 [Escallonia herrerae]
MDKLGFEEQVSISLDDHDTLVADSESDTSSSDQFRCFTKNGLIKVEEDRNEHDIIKKGFLVGMGQLGKETDVVAVHRNSYDGLTGQARFETFRIFSQAVAQKCGGSANIKYAWYGGSREEICEIISHGFSRCRRPEKIEVYGHGVNLSPAKFSIDGALSSGVDENGLRHMLLCRVILGKSEAICAGSDKFQPSSKEFDSGVDNLFSPRKYIIWSAYMNSHIFPNYVISFKAPSSVGKQDDKVAADTKG